MSPIRRIAIRIHGNVQGVGFRMEAKRKAGKLHLTGFVKNDPDGSVYMVAEGENAALEAFLVWCGRGPWGAGVRRVEAGAYAGTEAFHGFEVQ